MGDRNRTIRTVLRWTHLLIGRLVGVFVYTPMRDAEDVPLHRLAQLMGPGTRLRVSPDTTLPYVLGTRTHLQAAVEGIARR